MTEMRKQQNRIAMGGADGEYGDSAMGVDRGMAGDATKDTGKLRVTKNKQVKFTSNKMRNIEANAKVVESMTSCLALPCLALPCMVYHCTAIT